MRAFKKTVITGLLFSALLGCGSSVDSASDFVESGKELLEEGKTQKARLEFKNAIQVDPRLAEPFYQLALIDEQEQKWKAMLANLTTVERLDPTHYDAIVKLGQIHLLGGQLDVALTKANKVIEADSSNQLAWLLRASVEMKQENYEVALDDVEHALTLDANNIESLSLKSLIFNMQGKPEKALSVIDEALKIKPDQLPLTMIKLSILEEQKNFTAMEQVYKDQLVQRPEDSWVAISLAKLLSYQDRYDEAKEVLEDFVLNHPKDKQAKILLVSLVKTKQPERAIALLDSYIEQEPKDYELRFAKVKLQLDRDQISEAVSSLEQIKKLDANGDNGRKAQVMLAGYELQQGHVEVAKKEIDNVLTLVPENEGALLLRSRIQIAEKEYDSAVTNLRIILRNNPESEQALVMIAQAYMNTGSSELADDSFRQALTVNPSNTIAALSVAGSLMQENNLDRTEEVLVKALKNAKNKEPLLQALAQVRILKKDWYGTESVVDSLRVDKKDTAFTHFLSGQIAQGQKNYDTAILEYKNALEIRPDMTRALQQLATSYMENDDKKELISYLNEFINKNPELLAGYGILASVYRESSDWDNAIATIKKGIATEPRWEGGYSTLASVYLAQNKTAETIAIYQEGIEANPNSVMLPLQKASLYERIGEFDEAKSLYEGILARNPNVEPAINNLASLLTEHYATEENIKKAVMLAERFKSATEPYYLDTYAWAQVLQGNFSKAQSVLERVVSLSPDVAVFNYHLGALYLKQGNKLEAENFLKKAAALAEKQGDILTTENTKKLLESL